MVTPNCKLKHQNENNRNIQRLLNSFCDFSGKRDHLGETKISPTDLANSYLSHSGNGEEMGKRHSEEGVLRANIVKMENSINESYHQQHQHEHSGHTSVLTSLHSGGIPSQHVEVIQKVGGGHQSLAHHLPSPHDLSPKQQDGEQSVLQVMEKMQVPSYDPSVMYQRQQMYNKIPSVYETLGSGQYSLAGLPSTQHLLPAAYPSLLASNQDYYISQPRSNAEYYTTRPLQGMYQEGAEELLERYQLANLTRK